MLARTKSALTHAILFPFILILLFEEWGWTPLAQLFTRLARALALWRKCEEKISRLSPHRSLLILLLPMLTLLPLKFLGLVFIRAGRVKMGVFVFAVSKLCGTAFFSRLFSLTKTNLLKLGWFAWFYPRWVEWKNIQLTWIRSTFPWRLVRALNVKARQRLERSH